MAFRLTKEQSKRLAAIREKLTQLQAEVKEKQADLAQALSTMADGVNERIRAYNEELAELNSLASDVAGEARDAYDDKSEKWQEGDRGQAALAFVEAWENVVDGADDVEEIEIVSPDDAEFPDLDELPEEAEG